ncbi:unnamed protein product [Linum trigynum]|uniref:Uncharacterized protein n=1 Tax=Linum trigynum TaxID=586398 RepID=A0AAV2DWN3_9ROSI
MVGCMSLNLWNLKANGAYLHQQRMGQQAAFQLVPPQSGVLQVRNKPSRDESIDRHSNMFFYMLGLLPYS